MKQKNSRSVYDFQARTIHGSDQSLREYQGKVLLIVNVASKCGFTPQYKGLQALYDRFKDQDFEVLGFPCNQFGEQEPAPENEIQQFCELNFGVNFPLFAKVDVNGPATHPLFEYLKKEEKGFLGSEGIKWNFTKFLIDREGHVLKRFAPQSAPDSLEKDIVAALKVR